VAIRFIPDVAPVPILSAKGVAMPESMRIRTIVRENGRREIEDETFVLAMISKKPGETVPFELYDQLRNLIHTMYRT
jgi:flagellar biosynthesis protein FlhB